MDTDKLPPLRARRIPDLIQEHENFVAWAKTKGYDLTPGDRTEWKSHGVNLLYAGWMARAYEEQDRKQ